MNKDEILDLIQSEIQKAVDFPIYIHVPGEATMPHVPYLLSVGGVQYRLFLEKNLRRIKVNKAIQVEETYIILSDHFHLT